MEDEKITSEDVEVLSDEEIELWRPGKAPISFLRCSSCFLRQECPYCDPSSEVCALRALEEIDTSSGDGIISLVQRMLHIQAERVFRFVKIEETEGGMPDANVTNELLIFVSLVEKLKKILSDEDFLVIRAKGKAAEGVMERLFGGIGKE